MNGPFLRGVDVAYVQRIAAGGLIKNATSGVTLADLRDFDFVVIKATQGTTIVDSQWANSYAMARKFGKKVIAYHYNDNRVPVAEQAAKFLATAQAADAWVLDQEGTYGFSDAQAQEFVDAVRATGRECGLYHSASGYGGVNADWKWVADYRTESLKDGTTDVLGWDMWQFSSEGGPNGAGLDLDYLRNDSPLAAKLGLTYVSKTGADATAAALQAAIDSQALVIAGLKTDLTACNLQHEKDLALLAEAPAKERARIAAAEAARIEAL